ncbi:MAG TPA: GatB/YqeY domain-containing protein [Candidatus Eisenbacteria bacterium]|jgi:hypothetical protein
MSPESILEQIQRDLMSAMKSKDADTLSTLRMLKAALLEAKTKKPKDQVLDRNEEIEVLQRYAKKRREAVEELRKLGRVDLVPREEQEIVVTSRYLPQALSEDELRGLVQQEIQRLQAAGLKEAGKVIGAVMAQARGRADGAIVARLVQEALKSG